MASILFLPRRLLNAQIGDPDRHRLCVGRLDSGRRLGRVIKSPRGELDALLGHANLFRKTFSGLDCVEVREWL